MLILIVLGLMTAYAGICRSLTTSPALPPGDVEAGGERLLQTQTKGNTEELFLWFFIHTVHYKCCSTDVDDPARSSKLR